MTSYPSVPGPVPATHAS